MDAKVLEDIENAIFEENKKEVKAELEENNTYPEYLEKNKVTLTLSDYLTLYENTKQLNELVEIFIKESELNYDEDALRVNRYASTVLPEKIKKLAPDRYNDRYKELLNKDV